MRYLKNFEKFLNSDFDVWYTDGKFMTNGISTVAKLWAPKLSLRYHIGKVYELKKFSKFLVSKKFCMRGSRHIYSESTLHGEQEYIGLDLILCSSIDTHLPYYLWKYLSMKISIFTKKKTQFNQNYFKNCKKFRKIKILASTELIRIEFAQ